MKKEVPNSPNTPTENIETTQVQEKTPQQEDDEAIQEFKAILDELILEDDT